MYLFGLVRVPIRRRRDLNSPVHCAGRFSISEPLIKSLSIVYANERVGDYPPFIVCG